MYPVGVGSSFYLLLHSLHLPWSFPYSLACPLISLVALLCLSLRVKRPSKPNTAPVTLPGLRIFSILPFFGQRHDFLSHGFRVTGQNVFQFNLLRNPVLVVSGEKGRRDFFNAKGLDLQEGFRVLSGALPFVTGITSDLRQKRINQIYKRLGSAQHTERLENLIPAILGDCRNIMDSWGKSGSFDPFNTVYEVVFQTTVRALTCSEIANDPLVVARLRKLYDQVDRGTTPATVLFPWFPSPAMIRKASATKQIYDIVVKAVNVRKQNGVMQDDSLQMLLNEGDDHAMIVGFIMGLVIAGARSTGTIASWLITFLGCHPTWRMKALEEVRGLLLLAATQSQSTHAGDSPQVDSSHSTTTPKPRTPSESESYPSSNHPRQPEPITVLPPPLPSSSSSTSSSPPPPRTPSSAYTALSSIPLSTWESSTPILDSLIRETLRIAQPHVAMRRNVGPEVYIDGKALPSGAFAVYPFSDVHLNEGIYEEPWRFDPGRWEGGKEGGKEGKEKGEFGYIGWGGGRVNCLGKRLAQLEIKLIAAMFVLSFDFTIVDATGKAADPHPRPNWNDILACRPTNGVFALRYESAGADAGGQGKPGSGESSV
ncbi:cytochrome P450 [Stereum hirsutum FP-91666 SS1]|uniref:cytochrome P450 n=1 Tax=Stereum hirsutum (strain FP-91666) TaxID=721885 RepID=UPI000440D2DC|nr:cytochrome P450 [Stereum hirsutum FP-91666 SS1]EIM89162.1 cytochrome P450 [Stereum hirsutum FP-91666 SS1]